MKDYKSGKIYAIRNYVDDKIYIGSTVQTLSQRMAKHRSMINVKQDYNRKLYEKMREYGTNKFYIELIEDYPCKSKDELHAREGHFIRQYDSFNNGYNMLISGRNNKQYVLDTKEQKKAYDKVYRSREDIKQRNNERLKNQKVLCTQCNLLLRKDNLHNHIKTKRHLELSKVN